MRFLVTAALLFGVSAAAAEENWYGSFYGPEANPGILNIHSNRPGSALYIGSGTNRIGSWSRPTSSVAIGSVGSSLVLGIQKGRELRGVLLNSKGIGSLKGRKK